MAGPGAPYDEEERPSIFSRLWFRALLVVVVLGVVAVIAVPYVLDMLAPKQKVTRAPVPTVTPAPGAVTPAPTPPALPPAGTTAAPSTAAPAKPPEPPSPTAKLTETPRPTPAPPRETARAPEPSTPGSPVARVEPSTKPAPSKPASRPAVARTRAAAASGPYWVQVGAFRDQAAAKHLADRLRAENFRVEESLKPGGAAAAPRAAPASPGDDRYNVFVSGSTLDEVNAKVSARGLSADGVAGGVVVKPSLPLKEAVEVSQGLAREGLRVQVRRTAGAATTAPASGGETWHRVRVGSFPDRASAMTALKELEAKGYKPFLARGTQ